MGNGVVGPLRRLTGLDRGAKAARTGVVTSHEVAVGRAADLIADVDLPEPFSVREFLKQLAARRGRPIILHAVPAGWCGSANWCGAWLDTEACDHIVFVQDWSTVKTAQTVLHEVGHVLFEHPGQPLPDEISLGAVNRADIRRARGRTAFDTPEELSAEAFSTLVLQATMFGVRTDLSLAADPRSALLEVRLG